jgi:hypothetical protein
MSDRFALGNPVARNEAGALDFRDFSGLLTAKENRTGSRQTLLTIAVFPVLLQDKGPFNVMLSVGFLAASRCRFWESASHNFSDRLDHPGTMNVNLALVAG